MQAKHRGALPEFRFRAGARMRGKVGSGVGPDAGAACGAAPPRRQAGSVPKPAKPATARGFGKGGRSPPLPVSPVGGQGFPEIGFLPFLGEGVGVGVDRAFWAIWRALARCRAAFAVRGVGPIALT